MSLIKSLSARVENEQTRKLQELGTGNATTISASRNDFMSFESLPGASDQDTLNGNGDTDFEALVRGEKQSRSNGGDMLGGDPWASAPPSAMASSTLPSRPAGNLGRSSTASPAAAFSWSSPPISPPATNLSAPRSTSRTITPDNTLNSLSSAFPAIQPSNPGIGSSFSQTQATPTMGTGMSGLMSPTGAPSISTQSPGLNWGSTANSLSANPWGNTSSSTTGAPSSFSIAPPPPPPSQNQPQQASNPLSSFSIAPPPPNRTNSAFSVPPPTSGARGGGGPSMSSLASMSQQNRTQSNRQTQQSSQGWGSSGGDSLI
jgi:SCY1-like protein 2